VFAIGYVHSLSFLLIQLIFYMIHWDMFIVLLGFGVLVNFMVSCGLLVAP